MKILSAIALMSLLSGCAFNDLHEVKNFPIETLKPHDVARFDDRQYFSCDYKSWSVKDTWWGTPGNTFEANRDDYLDGASSMHALDKDRKKLATNAFVYAMMSNNVYRDLEEPLFLIPGWTVHRRFEGDSGLSLEEWHRKGPDGRLAEIAVAFRGTDGFLDRRDAMANFSIWKEPQQYDQAQKHVLALLENNPTVPITLTGHSLGGGIALNISLRQSTKDRKLKLYVFNTSPRGFYGVYPDVPGVERYFIDENGEFLKAARFVWMGKFNRLEKKITYNFLTGTSPVGWFKQHSIYRLARAMNLVAIGAGSSYAREVFKANLSLPYIADHIGWQTTTSDHDREICEALYKL